MNDGKLLHYRITEKLGAGSMGEVYRAVDERTERTVALKVVARARQGDTEGRARMLREARAAARLAHPGIVTLFAAEEADGEIFLVQEFVEGETLRERLARGPLSPAEVVRLASDVSDALRHAHEQGVLHRDLKPENILITSGGRFKIADFGIARGDGAPTLTIDGSLLGTIAYMAPERLKGEPGDARSDLFAVGAIVYEAVTGRRAFDARGEAEALYAVIEAMPARVEQTDRVLAAMQDLAFSLLAKDPAARPASAAAVCDALQEFQTTTRMTLRGRRVRRWLAPVAGAAAVLVLGAATWLGRGHLVAEAEADPAVAVLVFNNVVDPGDGARTGAITGTLLVNVLSQAGGLNVLSAQSVLDALRHVRPGGGPTDRQDALAVARRVHARRIVTGSILQVSPSLVVTAEVSDAATGRVLQSARIDGRPGQTVFEVVDALGARLLDRMVPHGADAALTPVAQRSSGNLQAQRDYVEGIEALSRGSIEDAVKSLSNAVALDPTFAQAHLQLAMARWWNTDSPAAEASIANARLFRDRLTPSERDLVEALDPLMRFDTPLAYERFTHLAARVPQDKLVQYGLVEAAFHSGNTTRALEAARAALVIDPQFGLPVVHLVDALSILGRSDDAEREARRLLARDPANGLTWGSLFQAMLRRNDPVRAMAVAREARAAHADQYVKAEAGHLCVAMDSVAAAKEWFTPTPTWSEFRQRDFRTAYAYKVALHRGHFTEAIALARRMWAEIPPITTDGAPVMPVTYGIPAALRAGDAASALAWSDSLTIRATERYGVSDAFSYRLQRAAILAELGQADAAASLLRTIEGSPDAHEPMNQRSLHATRAVIDGAQNRPQDALRELAQVDMQSTGYQEYNSLRYDRARYEIAAGHAAEAVARLDSVVQTPMLALDRGVLALYWRGVALERLGRTADAIASYRRFERAWATASPTPPELIAARAALKRLSRSA